MRVVRELPREDPLREELERWRHEAESYKSLLQLLVDAPRATNGRIDFYGAILKMLREARMLGDSNEPADVLEALQCLIADRDDYMAVNEEVARQLGDRGITLDPN